jgi:hypothetical protein
MARALMLLMLGAAALFDSTAVSSAQNVSQFPWCLEVNGPGAYRGCYYSSLQACLLDSRTRYGQCVPSPYYHPPRAPVPRRRRHS